MCSPTLLPRSQGEPQSKGTGWKTKEPLPEAFPGNLRCFRIKSDAGRLWPELACHSPLGYLSQENGSLMHVLTGTATT